MRSGFLVTFVALCTVSLVAPSWSRPQEKPEPPDSLDAQVAQIARIRKASSEDTFKTRNDRLNQVFRASVRDHGGQATTGLIRQFNALVKQHGMTNFDDFLEAETQPLRYRKDPATGALVPVLGSLGSDLINPWLAAIGIASGKPLDEQPMYRLATNALREHIDFAVIGVRDPQLSLDQLPPRLRENALQAYQRLNPTRKFDGGFDHPLYYAAIREAARKLFREDYPQLKLTMADLVVPEEAGGFGIRSCLLCHERSHTGVYQRLLGQGLYLQARAGELPKGSEPARHTQTEALVYLRAADTVHKSFPAQVDVQAARRALNGLEGDTLGRLRPGFPDFCAVLQTLGCMSCHSTAAKPAAEKNPVEYGAYVLDLNAYHQTANIKGLLKLVNLDNLDKSRLLMKATAKLAHEGADDAKLTGTQVEELRVALARWIQGVNGTAGEGVPPGSFRK